MNDERLPIDTFSDGEYIEPDPDDDVDGEDGDDGEEGRQDDDRYDAEGAPATSQRHRVPPDANNAPLPGARPQVPARPVPAPQPAPVPGAGAPAPAPAEAAPVEQPVRRPRLRRAPPPPVTVGPPSRSGDVPLSTWLGQFYF